MNVLYRLTVVESKLFLREPIVVFFSLVFPPALLIILGLVPAFREPSPELGGARTIDLYAPIAIAMAIAMLALSSLPQIFSTYREQGVLRRMATTPVRPRALLLAQVAMCTWMSLAALVVVLGIARFAFDVPLPENIPAYLVGYLLSLLAMLSFGLLIASLAPTAKAAGGISTLMFFPVLFFAGLWVPREAMPAVLRRISDFTPLGAGVQSLQDAAGGQWPQLLHLAVLIVWIAATGALATRYFRWE